MIKQYPITALTASLIKAEEIKVQEAQAAFNKVCTLVVSHFGVTAGRVVGFDAESITIEDGLPDPPDAPAEPGI